MDIVLKALDENIEYTANIENETELLNILKAGDFLINPFNSEIPLITCWFNYLNQGIIILDLKHLKCSIKNTSVT